MMKTNDGTKHPGALPQTPKAHQKAVVCADCACSQRVDAGVGWCLLAGQYRSLLIERECAEFRTRKTED